MLQLKRAQPLARAILPALSAALLLALAACGGGSGETQLADAEKSKPPVADQPVVDQPATDQPVENPPVVEVKPVLALAPSCSTCAAVDGNTYSGSGIGIWSAVNYEDASQDVQVDIQGLSNNTVTLILTNIGWEDAPMPPIALSPSSTITPLKAAALAPNPAAEMKRRISEFNTEGWRSIGKTPSRRPSVMSVMPRFSSTGETLRVFNDVNGAPHTTALKKTVTMPDGVVVNLWVETAEYGDGKVSAAKVDQLMAAFTRSNGIYDRVVELGGPLWGPHVYPDLFIPGTTQPFDIIVLNIAPDGRHGGTVGYFYAYNNFRRDRESAELSNESISIYLDSETMYLDVENGMSWALSALSHEAMHVSNYYRRAARFEPPITYEGWLEEMTAMMMDDLMAEEMTPAQNPVRDVRLGEYLRTASYSCSLIEFNYNEMGCADYGLGGSFGGFLLRQLGVEFYKNLLWQNTWDSYMALENAIVAVRLESSLAEELRRFAVTTATTLPAATAPAGYGFPQRIDGPFTLTGIDPLQYKSMQVLPTTVPAFLKPLANFPVVRPAVSGTYRETLRLPPYMGLSVIVQ